MILIVVVISAVASLGFFISVAQKNAEANSNYLTGVQNDKLQAVFAQFQPSDPLIQWEIDSSGSFFSPCSVTGYAATTSWYVKQNLSDSLQVVLIPQKGPGLPIVATLSIGYNAISKAKQITLSGPPYLLAIGGGPPNCVFEPATWANITLTIRNTNTQGSSLSEIQVNDGSTVFQGFNWYQVDQNGNIVSTLGAGISPLVIPAKATTNILLNSNNFIPNGQRFAKNSSLSIVVSSTTGNYFPTSYSTPISIPSSYSLTENLLGTDRDVVTFNASKSYSTDSYAKSYEWAIDVPRVTSGSCPSTFGPTTTFDTAYLTGQSVQYSPRLFGSSDCLTGPIRATLTVTDGKSFQATASPLIVSPDPNIDPVGSVCASKSAVTCPSTLACASSPCMVTVTVGDSFGNPMTGVVVNAVPFFGNVAPNFPSQTTDSTGQAVFMVTYPSGGGGALNFEAGALPPFQLSFP
jgi:hypothetical protein